MQIVKSAFSFYYVDMGANDLNNAQFSASIPPIMSGIKTGGDGMRIQLDIPESEMGEAAKLIAMRGKRLRVVVEVEPEPVKFG